MYGKVHNKSKSKFKIFTAIKESTYCQNFIIIKTIYYKSDIKYIKIAWNKSLL